MDKDNLQFLATLVKLKLANESQVNQFITASMKTIHIVVRNAVRQHQLLDSDAEDVEQDAILRALRYQKKWDAAKGKWVTYLSRMTVSTIGEHRREYAKQKRAADAARQDMRDLPL